MQKLIKYTLVGAMSLSATAAFAGGPVIEEGQPEVIEEQSTRSIGILPLLLIPLILCLVACGGGDDDPLQEPPKVP